MIHELMMDYAARMGEQFRKGIDDAVRRALIRRGLMLEAVAILEMPVEQQRRWIPILRKKLECDIRDYPDRVEIVCAGEVMSIVNKPTNIEIIRPLEFFEGSDLRAAQSFKDDISGEDDE